ncbi:RNA polymerase ii subunit a c-terminal domain phosphatase [Anaeramoeba flamelloides]|uniref:RNA polymerase II subunit A C-terminal domain phosphatase SSU72 n=1 Tax=Anaeramoeba flamelloides TaxID=1746091 RepID=A0ABQ8XLZ2_9EUKA|nr:RNA polymerase ii subunit a c-terminal domain phosphatase [Anaeramoeba flamelloides]
MTTLKIAVVCASNMNRSMRAHEMLKKHDYDVSSFGTNNEVRLPGKSISSQNVYNFGTPYEDMIHDLATDDLEFYSSNKILDMLERNKKIKRAPERIQSVEQLNFDLVITYENKVFEKVIIDYHKRTKRIHSHKPSFLVNLETIDSQQEAELCAKKTLDLVKKFEKYDNYEDNFEKLIEEFEEQINHNILYSVLFY